MRHYKIVLCVSMGVWGAVQACGGDNGTDTDASTDGTVADTAATDTGMPTDAAKKPDTGELDAGMDTSVIEAGPDGPMFVTVPYRCGVDGGTVTDCSQCSGFPEPCVFCDPDDASIFSGRCQTAGGACNAPNNFGRCACSIDAGGCPEAFQVCRQAGPGGQCRTCGETNNTNNLTCMGGGMCNANDGGCN